MPDFSSLPSPVTSGKKSWLLLVLVLALAARLFHAGDRVLWFDEAVSLLIAKASIPDIIAAAPDDTHSPFYYLMLHFLPRGELVARGFSALCGVLTVALVFLIGRKFGGATAGAISAGLMALCPLHVWYSQEVRMYALQTLLVTASWWLLFLALDSRCWRCWTAYAVAAALSLYAQYTSAFALVAQGIYVLWFRRDEVRPWLLAQAGVALLFAPCVPLFMHHLVEGTFGFWLGKFSWTDPLRFFALLSGAITKNPGPYWPWAVLSIVLLLVAAIRQGRKAAPLLLWLLAPVVLLALVSLRANAFLPRALLMVAPAFALLVGCAAADKKGATLAVLLAAANLFALQHYYFSPNPWIRSPLREASETVAKEIQTGDVIVHSSRFSYRPFQFYLGDNIAQGLAQPDNDEPLLYRVIGDGRLPAKEARRLWLVLWPDFQQPGFHNQVLSQMNARCSRHREVFSSPQLLVMLYEKQ
ncbi:MAG: hypothetical protein FJ395_15215 [Verrucomicrobia bacterium]|nr:hypothetical protein [Verrucomicrobiota bacterium]